MSQSNLEEIIIKRLDGLVETQKKQAKEIEDLRNQLKKLIKRVARVEGTTSDLDSTLLSQSIY